MAVVVDWCLALERIEIVDHSLGRYLKVDALGSLRKSVGRSRVLWNDSRERAHAQRLRKDCSGRTTRTCLLK